MTLGQETASYGPHIATSLSQHGDLVMTGYTLYMCGYDSILEWPAYICFHVGLLGLGGRLSEEDTRIAGGLS